MDLYLKNKDEIFSGLNYNRYVFEYDSLFTNDKLEIVVETSYFQVSYPVVSHLVSSYVGKYCMVNNVKFPLDFEGLTLTMNVQTLERTFVDKVFAVCDYLLEYKLERNSRHLYDIANILPNILINDKLKELIHKVRNDRMKSINNPSSNPKYCINKMLVDIINNRIYEPDYIEITKKLLYEKMNYDESIKKGIAIVLDSNLFK